MFDWIKIEKTLPDKLEVLQMAANLEIDEDAVVGKLIRFWRWVDDNLADCNAPSVTYSVIDRIANCKNFAKALVAVGWLEGREGRLTIPHFNRHFGQTAKTRAVTNKRVARHRAANKTALGSGQNCNGSGVSDVTLNALPEEEYNITTTTTTTARENANECVRKVEPYPRNAAEVAEFMRGLPLCGLRGADLEECANKYFLEMEERGWLTNHGFPVAKWKSGAEKYVTAWRTNLGKQQKCALNKQSKQPKKLTDEDYML